MMIVATGLAARLAAAPVLAAAFLTLASADPAPAQRREPPASREMARMSFAPVVRTAAPAVVNVFVRGRAQTQLSPFANDPLLREFFGDRFGMPRERIQSSLGSGVIVSADGVVVTNTHVVKVGSTSEIRVVLADKREFDARVVLLDEKTDIAVLRIQANGESFPYLEFADSDALEVGDLVLAIGNPFGVGQTVTSGIVSAVGRSEIGRADIQSYIQTDAAINPGNSGGALVDMAGRLAGINTAIYSRSGGSHGIGFAIPANLVRIYVASAVSGRPVQRPWLGARLEAVTRDIADALRLTRAGGALVTTVHRDSPAARAGLEPGDVITMVDGHEVADPRAVNYRLATRGVGSKVRLDVMRKGRTIALELPLIAPPQPGRGDVRDLAGTHPLDGARVANLTAHLADELGADDTAGVVVAGVREGSIAARLGFRQGDVIMSVGEVEVKTVADLERLLARRRPVWQMWVKRGGRALQLQVPG